MLPSPLAIPPKRADRQQAAGNFLARHGGLILCALFLLAGLATAGDYGITEDEPNQRQIAQANLDYILGRAAGIATLNAVDQYYGAAFELPLLLAEGALGQADYYQIHRLRATLAHLFFIIGGFFCYLLAYRLFNNRLIALFALLFYLLHPRIYGHSFFNTKDPVFLSMFSIALYLLERAFRRNTPAAFILLGVAVGLLTNLRIMGIMLLPAVIAMRGLDWFYAGNSGAGAGGNSTQRKGILLTGGLFFLAAVLTAYALAPYAWTNPAGYWTANLDLTVNHPLAFPQLFRGQWFPADQLPPHYTAAWFAITTPLPLMLLGAVGIGAAGAAALRQPRRIFRNGPLRLAALLLAALLLPPLAAALLGSRQYDDWRHFYFLYAPFCLLAAGGLGWIAAALSRRRPWNGLTAALSHRRPWRRGLYGLTAAGLALALLQLIQIHPLQHLYFNSLVDRATPEKLRQRYTLRFPELAYWAALQQLRETWPGAPPAVGSDYRWEDNLPLSPADRARLLFLGGSARRADYTLTPMAAARPDLSFNNAYRRLYNNTVAALRPLDSARMTAAAIAAYREIYRQATAGEPIIRADYTVYRHGQRLTFVKENCPPTSRDAWFSAQAYPPPRRAAAAAPPHSFGNHRVQLDDLCLAVIQLPNYIRGDVVIAQHNLVKFRPDGLVWEQLYSLNPPGLRERIAAHQAAARPTDGAAPSAFEVFLDQDPAGRYRLLYAKANCAPAEYGPAFLHITPKNRAALPFYQWASGVDNREISLARYGVRSGGECLAVYPLPNYPIAALLTGQTGIWETNLYPPANPDTLRAAYAALANRQPNARANFDLYLQDNQLTYLRETCAAADTAANFFLHITPMDTADLPPERQDAGFANQDFPFARYGGPFDGQCLATVPLPDYPIKTLRTGQYIPNQGELWSAEFTPQP